MPARHTIRPSTRSPAATAPNSSATNVITSSDSATASKTTNVSTSRHSTISERTAVFHASNELPMPEHTIVGSAMRTSSTADKASNVISSSHGSTPSSATNVITSRDSAMLTSSTADKATNVSTSRHSPTAKNATNVSTSSDSATASKATNVSTSRHSTTGLHAYNALYMHERTIVGSAMRASSTISSFTEITIRHSTVAKVTTYTRMLFSVSFIQVRQEVILAFSASSSLARPATACKARFSATRMLARHAAKSKMTALTLGHGPQDPSPAFAKGYHLSLFICFSPIRSSNFKQHSCWPERAWAEPIVVLQYTKSQMWFP
jgi:hypothetical protein